MTSLLRGLRVGDRVPSTELGPMRTRRLDATAVLLPGHSEADAYRRKLDERAPAFAEWDGRIHVADADGEVAHRVLVVDRYRQIYAVHDEADAAELPDGDALVEWFRFLATACPECGVLDDPLLAGPTP